MLIKILSVSIESVKTSKGGYHKADVAYKDEQGKTQGKKVMSFTNEKVFDTLKNAEAGDEFTIKSEKDANNYWQWTDIVPTTGRALAPDYAAATAIPSRATPSPKSTYETPEERAEKQRLIVRQSSLSNALEYSKNIKAVKSLEELLSLAENFASFVHQASPTPVGTIAEMKDDTEGII